MKRNYTLIIIFLLGAIGWSACKTENGTSTAIVPHVLIFTKTRAFRHECIEPGVNAMQAYLSKHGITTVHSEDSLMFTPDKLKSFDAIMFFQTTGNVLDSL